MTQLNAQFDSRKSFYGKAQVETDNGTIKLWSYSTMVAYIDSKGAHVNGTYSMTTLRHIKEFLLQNGYKADSKKQILTDYAI